MNSNLLNYQFSYMLYIYFYPTLFPDWKVCAQDLPGSKTQADVSVAELHLAICPERALVYLVCTMFLK